MMPTLLFQDLPRRVADVRGSFSHPPAASDVAHDIDGLYNFITGVGIFFAILIFGVLFLFVFRYWEKRHPKAERTATHNTPLELVWSILPAFVLAYMFWHGFKIYLDVRTPPSDAYEIQVVGQKWFWEFVYPNGTRTSELHLPANTPIQLRLTSRDVIHSFFIPAFRTKMDAVPGRYTRIWFVPRLPGEYAALCAEYCGTKHSQMLAKVYVDEPADFETWLEEQGRWFEGMDPVEVGRVVHTRKGCASCHSIDGSPGQGPTWLGIWGKDERTDKGTVVVDENYIRESILEPNARIVSGYNPIMPTYKGVLKEEEIEGVIAFIKSLKQD